jgi:hypothetical protein
MFAFGPGIGHWYCANLNIQKSQRLGGLGIRTRYSDWILSCQNFAYRTRSRIQRPRAKHCYALPWLTRSSFLVWPVSPKPISSLMRYLRSGGTAGTTATVLLRLAAWRCFSASSQISAGRPCPFSLLPYPLCYALSPQGGWKLEARWLEALGGGGFRTEARQVRTRGFDLVLCSFPISDFLCNVCWGAAMPLPCSTPTRLCSLLTYLSCRAIIRSRKFLNFSLLLFSWDVSPHDANLVGSCFN